MIAAAMGVLLTQLRCPPSGTMRTGSRGARPLRLPWKHSGRALLGCPRAREIFPCHLAPPPPMALFGDAL